jgi:hypothetical protein
LQRGAFKTGATRSTRNRGFGLFWLMAPVAP